MYLVDFTRLEMSIVIYALEQLKAKSFSTNRPEDLTLYHLIDVLKEQQKDLDDIPIVYFIPKI